MLIGSVAEDQVVLMPTRSSRDRIMASTRSLDGGLFNIQSDAVGAIFFSPPAQGSVSSQERSLGVRRIIDKSSPPVTIRSCRIYRVCSCNLLSR